MMLINYQFVLMVSRYATSCRPIAKVKGIWWKFQVKTIEMFLVSKVERRRPKRKKHCCNNLTHMIHNTCAFWLQDG